MKAGAFTRTSPSRYAKKIKKLKDEFLNKYNLNRTQAKALSSGITASVQHNSLYRKNLERKLKEAVLCEWRSFLEGLVDRYKNSQCVAVYENDVENLKNLMNKKFSAAFLTEPHNRYKTDPGNLVGETSLGSALKIKFNSEIRERNIERMREIQLNCNLRADSVKKPVVVRPRWGQPSK